MLPRAAWLLMVATMLAGASAWAEETAQPAPVTRIIKLDFASAAGLARQFATLAKDAEKAPERLSEERRAFLQRAIVDSTRTVRPVPQVMQEPGLYPFSERTYAEARVAQASLGGLSSFLPEGLSDPPTALLDQNALIVKGTPKAVDEFAEILRLFDVPPKQVNIEVKLVNVAERIDQGWGADVAGRGGNAQFSLQGPAPAGPLVRILGESLDALLAGNQSISRNNSTAGANVTTTNNTPCIIRAATVIPVVLASIAYDQWGNRHVDYTVDAVATGVELFALPRINSDDTVTMRLRPTFIDATGQVVGPDGSAIPITEQTSVDTLVRVRDGETLFLGGFPRSVQALQATGLPLNFRESTTIEDVESLLFVTPRIVRLLQP